LLTAPVHGLSATLWEGDQSLFWRWYYGCKAHLRSPSKAVAQKHGKWMGHGSYETTLRYAHLAPNRLETLADALTKYGTPPLRAVAA
jgi:hypothetical protein